MHRPFGRYTALTTDPNPEANPNFSLLLQKPHTFSQPETHIQQITSNFKDVRNFLSLKRQQQADRPIAKCLLHQHTHTHPFNGPFSGTTRVSQYQKGKSNLDFTEARHQLGHMQVCISLQTDNHAIAPPLSFFTGRMPFLPPNQQRLSTCCYTN